MSGRSSNDDGATGTRATTAAVRDRLDRVTDPELDESIVALDYIDDIAVDAGAVTVDFTLPTAWCSPAFAWMMATDARDEVESLPGVTRATIRLHDHMHETGINEGVNARKSFGETFPDAEGGVAEVRATLDAKARFARQYDAINALLDAGLDYEQVVSLDPVALALDDDPATVYIRDRTVAVTVSRDPLTDYLEKARAVDLLDDGGPLFRTPDGDPIPVERAEQVHKRARLASVNMTGQGSVCDALNEARRAEDRPPLSKRTPAQD